MVNPPPSSISTIEAQVGIFQFIQIINIYVPSAIMKMDLQSNEVNLIPPPLFFSFFCREGSEVLGHVCTKQDIVGESGLEKVGAALCGI